MATKQTGGIAHLTVVPENFDPDAEPPAEDAGPQAGESAGSRTDR